MFDDKIDYPARMIFFSEKKTYLNKYVLSLNS